MLEVLCWMLITVFGMSICLIAPIVALLGIGALLVWIGELVCDLIY